MKAEFYDVKIRQKVEIEIKYKKKTPAGRCMIYGETADGRKLPKFTNEADYDVKYKSVPVEGEKPAAKKACCKKSTKK